jgi:hypothetical protein
MSERIEIKHTLEVTSTKYIFMLTGNPGKCENENFSPKN